MAKQSSDHSTFEEATELSRHYPKLISALKIEVEEAVQREVARVATSTENELRRALHDIVRERSPGIASGGFLPLSDKWKRSLRLAIVGLLALVLGTQLDRVLGGTEGPPEPPAQLEPGAKREGMECGSPAGDQFATCYNLLFMGADSAFDTLIAVIRRSTPPDALEAALDSWERDPEGAGTQAQSLVHAAFVQAVLKQGLVPGIAIDGEITRSPCGGDTCGALLRLWEEDQRGFRLLTRFTLPLSEQELQRMEEILVYNYVTNRQP